MVAIDEGRGDDWKGTLGRLINDPELADTIEDVTERRARSGSRASIGFEVVARRARRVQRVRARAACLRDRRAPRPRRQVLPVELEQSTLGGAAQRLALRRRRRRPRSSARQVIEDELAVHGRSSASASARSGSAAASRSRRSASAPTLLLIGTGSMLSADVYGSFTPTPRLKIAGALAVFRSIYIWPASTTCSTRPATCRSMLGNTERAACSSTRSATVATTSSARRCSSPTPISSTLLRVYGAMLTSALSSLAAGERREQVDLVAVGEHALGVLGERAALAVEHHRVDEVRRVLERLAQRDARGCRRPRRACRASCRPGRGGARRCPSSRRRCGPDQDVDADRCRRAAGRRCPSTSRYPSSSSVMPSSVARALRELPVVGVPLHRRVVVVAQHRQRDADALAAGPPSRLPSPSPSMRGCGLKSRGPRPSRRLNAARRFWIRSPHVSRSASV